MPPLDDKVWFDSKRKFAGICEEVQQHETQNRNVLLLTHFQTTLSILESSLKSASIDFAGFSIADTLLLCSMEHRGRILVGLARSFQVTSPQIHSSTNNSSVDIIVAEHHPTHTKDRMIVETAARLACSPSVCFHTSLDDPMMKLFGGDNLVSLMKRLGAEESTPISHSFVTSAIRNAQEKIEKKAQRDMQTESIEDWFRYNLRDGWS